MNTREREAAAYVRGYLDCLKNARSHLYRFTDALLYSDTIDIHSEASQLLTDANVSEGTLYCALSVDQRRLMMSEGFTEFGGFDLGPGKPPKENHAT